jgi:hypothetical protein
MADKYGITVGGYDTPKRKQPKKKKGKTMHSKYVKGGGSIEMQNMLKKAYKGDKPDVMLGQ